MSLPHNSIQINMWLIFSLLLLDVLCCSLIKAYVITKLERNVIVNAIHLLLTEYSFKIVTETKISKHQNYSCAVGLPQPNGLKLHQQHSSGDSLDLSVIHSCYKRKKKKKLILYINITTWAHKQTQLRKHTKFCEISH